MAAVIVKTASRRRWEWKSEKGGLYKAKKNQAILVKAWGYTLEPWEEELISERTFIEDQIYFQNVFEKIKMPQLKQETKMKEWNLTGKEIAPPSDRRALRKDYVRPKDGRRLRVVFIDQTVTDGASTEQIKFINLDVLENTTDHIIFILPNTTRQDLGLFQGKIKYTVFQEWQLYTTSVHHHLNQYFYKLNPDQIEILIKNMRTSRNNFPRILTSDPNVVHFGLIPNDLIMIIRRDILTGGPEFAIEYRVVTMPPQEIVKSRD